MYASSWRRRKGCLPQVDARRTDSSVSLNSARVGRLNLRAPGTGKYRESTDRLTDSISIHTKARRIATAGFAVATVCALVLIADSWVNRTPETLCDERGLYLDAQALKIDTSILNGASGSWELWPTGLTCHYIQLGGTQLTVGPSPIYSVVLIVLIVGVVAAIAALTVKSLSRSRDRGPSRI